VQRAARITSGILLTILCILVTNAEAVTLKWSPVDTAVDGTAIPALIIYYKIYWSSDDSNWNFAADTAETELSLDSITSGCYFLYVSAVRSDTDQESAPSDSLQYCYGDVVGPAEITSEPSQPQGMNVE
jgi:hypothetical protein